MSCQQTAFPFLFFLCGARPCKLAVLDLAFPSPALYFTPISSTQLKHTVITDQMIFPPTGYLNALVFIQDASIL